MNFKEASEILTKHNRWRRDEHVPNRYEMVNPTLIGIAIEKAIEALDIAESVQMSEELIEKARTDVMSAECCLWNVNSEDNENVSSKLDNDMFVSKAINALHDAESTLRQMSSNRTELGFASVSESSELRNLDVTLAKYIAPKLKAFSESTISHPKTMSMDAWKDTLEIMTKAFVLLAGNKIKDGCEECEHIEDCTNSIIDTGLSLFSKYYRDLWSC